MESPYLSHLQAAALTLPWGGQLGAPFPKTLRGDRRRGCNPLRDALAPQPPASSTPQGCAGLHTVKAVSFQPLCSLAVCVRNGVGVGALERESGLEEPRSPDQSSDGTGCCTGAQPVTLPLFQPCSPLSNHGRTHCSFSSRREGAASSLVSDCLCPQGCYWSPKRAP